jgi:hypothetical protein
MDPGKLAPESGGGVVQEVHRGVGNSFGTWGKEGAHW